jgi:hypothetical protein
MALLAGTGAVILAVLAILGPEAKDVRMGPALTPGSN